MSNLRKSNNGDFTGSEYVETEFTRLLAHANKQVSDTTQGLDFLRAELDKAIENHKTRMLAGDENFKEKYQLLLSLTREHDEITRAKENLLSPPLPDGTRYFTSTNAEEKYWEIETRLEELSDNLIPEAKVEFDAMLQPQLEVNEEIMTIRNKIEQTEKKLKTAQEYEHRLVQLSEKLNENSKSSLLEGLKHLDIDEKIKYIYSKNDLLKLLDIGLLDESNIGFIIHDTSIDKSARARLTSLGLGDLNKNDVQNRWGWSCVAIEAYIASELQRPGVMMKDVFEYARDKRKKIAEMEGVDRVHGFGELRGEWYGIDMYSKERTTVANNQIFPGLVELIELQNEKMSSINHSRDGGNNSTTYSVGDISSIKSCVLPDMFLSIKLNDKGEINEIKTRFNFIRDFNASMDALGKHYLPKFNSKNLSQDELLKNLGEFVFHMARLYPLRRGSGAVVEWLARGILKNHYPDIQFSNLRIGSNLDVPYDIAAHLVLDSKLYAEIFARSIAMQISQEKFAVNNSNTHPTMSTNLISGKLSESSVSHKNHLKELTEPKVGEKINPSPAKAEITPQLTTRDSQHQKIEANQMLDSDTKGGIRPRK